MIETVLTYLTYIFSAVVLLGLCIFIHELGHLIGGKMVGIKAEVFSIGYGRGVLKKKIGDTTYQLTLIPFGGYCKFYGENPAEERKGEEYEFLTAGPLKRIVVVIMGPLFNLFFGIFLFFIMNMVGYPTETNRVYIPERMKTGEYVSPAHLAGIKTGDKIIAINDDDINNFSNIQGSVVFSEGKKLSVTFIREGKKQIISVKPRKMVEGGYFNIGVMPYGDKVLVMSVLEGQGVASGVLQKLDEIKAIDGKRVKTPEEFTNYIRSHAEKKISLTIIRRGTEITRELVPEKREEIIVKSFTDSRFKGKKYSIRVLNKDRVSLIKNAIVKRTVKLNDRVVNSFDDFIQQIKKHQNKSVKIENSGGVYYGTLEYNKFGFLGIGSAIAPNQVIIKHGILGSFANAVVEPYDFIVMNLRGIGMLISGKLNVRKNLSGPIRIAKIAGDTAHYRGISAFIILMAKISVILMVMNLLPIPVVDGSYIIFFLIEAIKGSPINEKIFEKIQLVGITLLIMLGIFVIFNDLSIFPFFQDLFN